jgi:hypothetical protein
MGGIARGQTGRQAKGNNDRTYSTSQNTSN